MSPEANQPTLSRMDEVKQRYSHWRQTREKRSPIPEDLWKAAVDLVGEYTPYQVVKGLRVNGGELRKRLTKNTRSQQGGIFSHPAAAHFVELDLPPSAPAGEGGEYTLELEQASGRKFRLRGSGKLDVSALVQAFWGLAE